jgi:hypothetical protein
MALLLTLNSTPLCALTLESLEGAVVKIILIMTGLMIHVIMGAMATLIG